MRRGRRLEHRLVGFRAARLESAAPERELSALLEQLELRYERKGPLWFVEVADSGWASLTWVAEEAVAALWVVHDGVPAPSPELVRANAEPGLGWYAVNDSDRGEELLMRAAVPMEGFDRPGLVLALGALAREADGEAPDLGGEPGAGLEAALKELGLDAPGGQLETDLGPLALSLHDERLPCGDVLDVRFELETLSEPPDEALAWWMLTQSNWSDARLGVDGAHVLSASCAVSARPVSAGSLAWAIANCLRLARHYREAS